LSSDAARPWCWVVRLCAGAALVWPSRAAHPATQSTNQSPKRKRKRAAEGEQEQSDVVRKKAGGGGAGVTRPQRPDRERQWRIRTEPAQDEALREACKAFFDPVSRLAACRKLERTRQYDAVLPLSPCAQPCVSPHCKCDMSFHQLKNSLGLGSPSVAKNYKDRASEAGQANAARRASEKQAAAAGARAAVESAAAEEAARVLMAVPRHESRASPSASPADSPRARLVPRRRGARVCSRPPEQVRRGCPSWPVMQLSAARLLRCSRRAYGRRARPHLWSCRQRVRQTSS